MVEKRRTPTDGRPETPVRRAVLDAWPLPAIPGPGPEPVDEPLAREGTEDEPITERFPVLPSTDSAAT